MDPDEESDLVGASVGDPVGASVGDLAAARVTRRRVESRRRLVQAARAAFAERGIRETPVELICERAGFTRGAFYSNFDSKEELFLAVYEEEGAERRRQFAEALRVVGEELVATDLVSGRHVVAEIARRYVTAYTGDETWFLLVSELRLQALRQPALRPRVVAAIDASLDDLVGVLESFLEHGGLKLAVSVRHAVRTVLALYEDALVENLLAGQPLTADNEFLVEVIPRLMTGLVDWPADAVPAD